MSRRSSKARYAVVLMLSLTAAAATAALTVAGTARAGFGCAVDSDAPDTWYAVGVPSTQPLVGLGAVGDDPCQAAAATADRLWVSVDAGQHWRAAATPPAMVTALLTDGAGQNAVVASTTTAGTGGVATPALLVSHDGGNTYAAATLPAGATFGKAVAAATSAGDSDVLYVALDRGDGPAEAPSMLVSLDGGASFSASSGSTVLTPVAVTVNPDNASEVWVASAAPDAARDKAPTLWRSTDGGTTFSSTALPTPGAVTDIGYGTEGVAPMPLYTAGDFGVLRSTDDGANWQQVAGPGAAVAVRALARSADRAVAVSGGTPYVVGGQAATPAHAGLPDTCGADRLDRAGTSGFVVARCAPLGRYYRFHPRGGVAGSPAPTGGGGGSTVPQVPPGSPAAAPPPPTQMDPLRTYSLPFSDGSSFSQTNPGSGASSGTIAFDGRILYYLATGDGGDKGAEPGTVVVHRLRASDGYYLGSLRMHIEDADYAAPNGADTTLTYDSRRNLLYVVTIRGHGGGQQQKVYSYDLRTGDLRYLMAVPVLDPNSENGESVSYDASLDAFVVGGEVDVVFGTVSRTGKVLHQCDIPYAGIDGLAAVVAKGDRGAAYVQLEDDVTVNEYGPNCALRRSLQHRRFDEALAEDDSAACDSQTFGVPAMWLRDAGLDRETGLNTITAYTMPGGYCPLATAVAVTVAPTLRLGGTTLVCAHLTAMHRFDVAGQPVSLDAAGVQLGYVKTDPHGMACATAQPGRTGVVPVHAKYYGTRAMPQFLGSSDATTLTVFALPVPARRVVAIAPPPPPQPQPLQIPQPQPQPNPAPAEPAPVPAPNVNPQAQAQANAQANANANPVAVAEEQEQHQVAVVKVEHTATREEYAMTRRTDPLLPSAAVGAAGLLYLTGYGIATSDRTRTRPCRVETER